VNNLSVILSREETVGRLRVTVVDAFSFNHYNACFNALNNIVTVIVNTEISDIVGFFRWFFGLSNTDVGVSVSLAKYRISFFFGIPTIDVYK